jgi:hypothetical protein
MPGAVELPQPRLFEGRDSGQVSPAASRKQGLGQYASQDGGDGRDQLGPGLQVGAPPLR